MSDLVGKILVCTWGRGMVINTFYVVESETPKTIVVRKIGARRISGDWQQGKEVADLEAEVRHPEAHRFKKDVDPKTGSLRFWHSRFQSWLEAYDGTPCRFDSLD